MLSLMLVAALVAPPSWPQFRGTGAAGVDDAANPPAEFGPDKNLAWKVPVPAGFSSPVVWGDALFLTGLDGGKLYTLCYSRADGKELWRREAPADKLEAYHKTEGSPAASTVATDGTRVVAYFGSCGLVCYDFAGNKLWEFRLPVAKTANDFGTGTSPILADGLVILGRDVSNGSKLFALDAATGSLKWEAPRERFPTSFASPAVWDTPAGKQVVVPGAMQLCGYELTTGKLVWTVSGLAAVPCTTPVVVDGNLVYAAWSPGGSAEFKMPSFDELLKTGDANGDGAIDAKECDNTFIKGFFENNDTNHDGKITRDEWDAQIKFMSAGKNVAVSIRPGGTGEISATHVNWKLTKGLPYVPSPLAYKGQLITVNMRGLVSAANAQTGAEVYLDENVGLTGVYASPVGAGGRVYLFGLDGTAVVLKAGADSPEVLSKAKLGERVAATPAVVGDVMYVRGAKHLFAFAAGK